MIKKPRPPHLTAGILNYSNKLRKYFLLKEEKAGIVHGVVMSYGPRFLATL